MEKTSVVHRLSPEVYAELEKTVPPSFVTAQTTELQAGFQLGVQHVLKVLREGYVMGR